MYPDNVPMYVDLLVSANPGMTEAELREFLEGVGWVDSEIEKGVAAFLAKKAAPAVPRQSAPQQVSSAQVQASTAPAAPVTATAPVAPVAPMPAPVVGPSAVVNPFIPAPTIVAAPFAQAPDQPQQTVRPGQSLTQAQVTNRQTQTQNQVSFGLKPVPAFEGMPHQADVQIAAMQNASTPAQNIPIAPVRPVVAQPMPQPATIEKPEIQPFNQAGFVQAPAPADTRFANGIRRVPSGMGAMGVTAPELTPAAQQVGASLNQDALSSPLYNTTPEAYAGYADAPKQKSHAFMWVVILFLFAGLAGTAAAQFLGYNIIPRSVLGTLGLTSNIIDPSELITRLAQGGLSIQSAEYSIRTAIKAEDRKPGEKPFVPTTLASDAVVYKRDSQRFDDVGTIIKALNMHYGTERSYPYTLEGLKVPTKDSMGSAYVYRRGPDGETFELVVTYESLEALELAELLTKKVKGNEVTFSERSSVYRTTFTGKPTSKSILVSTGIPVLLDYVDNNLDAGLEVSGTFDRRPKSTDASLSLSGHYYNSGMKEDMQLNMRKKDTIFFAQVAVVPEILKKLAPDSRKGLVAIEGKWFGDTVERILAQDTFSWAAKLMNDTSTTTSAKDNVANSSGTQIGEIIAALQNENMIKYRQEPVQESIHSVPAYRYDLVLDYERMADFVDRLKKDFDTRYSNASILKQVKASTIEYMRSASFMEEVRYFNEHSSFVVWATPDGKPLKVEVRQIVIPDDSVAGWKSKQAVAVSTIELSKIDVPVVVEAPKEYMNIEEYSMLISGYTPTENTAALQMKRVKNIEDSMRSYYMKNKSYPAQLSDITQPKQLMEYTVPLDEREFVDLYTKQPFVYRSLNNGTSYELDYRMTLPSSSSNSEFVRVVSQYRQVVAARVTNVRTLTVVNGVNTMSPKGLSSQRARVTIKDTDKDSYSDELEKFMGRNPLKAEKNSF